jgi:hypothetical protein
LEKLRRQYRSAGTLPSYAGVSDESFDRLDAYVQDLKRAKRKE